MDNPQLHVVLYQPEIPQNTGNIGRTCVAVGAKLWMVEPLGFQIDDKQVRRAGLDYWEHLDWEVVDCWESLCEQLPVNRHWYLTKHGERSCFAAPYQRGDVLVFGNESSGLPPAIRAADPRRALRIPMRPEVRSLNLASAATAVVYLALQTARALPPS